jgi:hypothetical protein
MTQELTTIIHSGDCASSHTPARSHTLRTVRGDGEPTLAFLARHAEAESELLYGLDGSLYSFDCEGILQRLSAAIAEEGPASPLHRGLTAAHDALQRAHSAWIERFGGPR